MSFPCQKGANSERLTCGKVGQIVEKSPSGMGQINQEKLGLKGLVGEKSCAKRSQIEDTEESELELPGMEKGKKKESPGDQKTAPTEAFKLTILRTKKIDDSGEFQEENGAEFSTARRAVSDCPGSALTPRPEPIREACGKIAASVGYLIPTVSGAEKEDFSEHENLDLSSRLRDPEWEDQKMQDREYSGKL